MFFVKKAELSLSKLIVLIITIAVIGIMITQFFGDSGPENLITKNIIENMKLESQLCDATPNYCNVKICIDSDCTEDEIKKSKIYNAFIDECDKTPEDKKGPECKGVLYNKIKGITEINNQNDNQYLIENINNAEYINTDLNSALLGNVIKGNQITTYNKLKNIRIGLFTNGAEYLEKKSKENGINPILAFYVLHRESRGDPNAISYTGCAGLFQFCYNTAFKDYSHIFGNSGNFCKNRDINTCKGDPRFDPEKAISAGTEYLAKLSKRYNGNVPLILTGYNAGMGIADKCTAKLNKDETIKCILIETEKYYGGFAKRNEVAGYIGEIDVNYENALASIQDESNIIES